LVDFRSAATIALGPDPVKSGWVGSRSKGSGARDLWGFDWHLAARFSVPAEGVFGSWQAARKPQRSKTSAPGVGSAAM